MSNDTDISTRTQFSASNLQACVHFDFTLKHALIISSAHVVVGAHFIFTLFTSWSFESFRADTFCGMEFIKKTSAIVTTVTGTPVILSMQFTLLAFVVRRTIAVWLIVLNCTLASIKTVASTHVVITMNAFIACFTAAGWFLITTSWLNTNSIHAEVFTTPILTVGAIVGRVAYAFIIFTGAIIQTI